MELTYGTLCSGIESATVAVEPLGWKAVWFAEIEPFPCAVLAHHYSDVPNLGDMTHVGAQVRIGDEVAPDVLIAGTPCQAFSVAGTREGLADERGQLTLEYVKLIDDVDRVRSENDAPPNNRPLGKRSRSAQ
ncbi:DNA cytosine methyltransferase [Pseudomonas citronellolis]|uniref:DNA cytosine methyltransferase n=1 Tax=Pseudomonas citronellolis TaxID=53408 RepID=UPI003CD0C76A